MHEAGTQNGRRRKSTIYDIASETNASPSTVSLVLNGSWSRYRIKEDTALRIQQSAKRLGYNVNLKARGLRLSRSGLAGMILPHYRNRFFAELVEAFEAEARKRQLCPIVVSTQRDPAVETRVTETLLAQRVEFLFIAGVPDPTPMNALCRAAEVPCVNLDLPADSAPSIVSNNADGAQRLTERVMSEVSARGGDPRDLVYLGGVAGEYASDNRVAGFKAAFSARGLSAGSRGVLPCGYPSEQSCRVFRTACGAGRQAARRHRGQFHRGVRRARPVHGASTEDGSRRHVGRGGAPALEAQPLALRLHPRPAWGLGVDGSHRTDALRHEARDPEAVRRGPSGAAGPGSVAKRSGGEDRQPHHPGVLGTRMDPRGEGGVSGPAHPAEQVTTVVTTPYAREAAETAAARAKVSGQVSGSHAREAEFRERYAPAREGGLVLAVDIGLSGAAALLDDTGALLDVVDLPTLDAGPACRPEISPHLFAAIVRRWAPSRAWVEHIGPRLGDRPAGAFAFGGSKATVETALAVLGVPFRTITPAVWKSGRPGSLRGRA